MYLYIFFFIGEYFAWLNGKDISIASTASWKVIAKIERPKAFQIEFSPKGTYILSWEQFTGKMFISTLYSYI